MEEQLKPKTITITNGYTLFIDRDGVINKEKKGDYIYNWEEFEFLDGVLEALKICNTLFDHILIMTNQRGVGRGLMTRKQLLDIHDKMKQTITSNGGRIDDIYYCIDDGDASPNRKPNPGMGLRAARDYPTIDLKKTFMVGNRMSDMKFARKLEIKSVFVATTHPEVPFPNDDIDYRFDDFLSFVKALTKS